MAITVTFLGHEPPPGPRYLLRVTPSSEVGLTSTSQTREQRTELSCSQKQ